MSVTFYFVELYGDLDQTDVHLSTLIQKLSKTELRQVPKRIRDEFDQRIISLPRSLQPDTPFEVVRSASAITAIPSVLSHKCVFKKITPRLCLGYTVNQKKLAHLCQMCQIKYRAALSHTSRGSTLEHVRAHVEQRIGHSVRTEHVWLEGEDVAVLSLCSNWEMSKKLKESVPLFRDIVGGTENPKWYLDIWHSQWKQVDE
ncbi:hypothetical protein CERSUDRAFT_99009 [Gelatoporia subvermispora B]|uniref:Uncharacterized protein n=1 Tax=Ceriporiopsis subvermispora (strain B) TaxID=914234 RepID=M2QLJ0_CERS8|nr:hypothetical protein CERSUDRAFT_99009 [Gelatoporia subvermispora B]